MRLNGNMSRDAVVIVPGWMNPASVPRLTARIRSSIPRTFQSTKTALPILVPDD